MVSFPFSFNTQAHTRVDNISGASVRSQRRVSVTVFGWYCSCTNTVELGSWKGMAAFFNGKDRKYIGGTTLYYKDETSQLKLDRRC